MLLDLLLHLSDGIFRYLLLYSKLSVCDVKFIFIASDQTFHDLCVVLMRLTLDQNPATSNTDNLARGVPAGIAL